MRPVYGDGKCGTDGRPFGVSVPDAYRPRYNCAPGQHLPIVVDDGTLRMAEWNFPHTSADETYINARRETITSRSALADAFEQRRCLVPADGFYVWRTEHDRRQPYRVAFPDDRLFAMAGIYAEWTETSRQTGLGEFTPGNEPTETTTKRGAFAIVTAPAPSGSATTTPRGRDTSAGRRGRWLTPTTHGPHSKHHSHRN